MRVTLDQQRGEIKIVCSRYAYNLLRCTIESATGKPIATLFTDGEPRQMKRLVLCLAYANMWRRMPTTATVGLTHLRVLVFTTTGHFTWRRGLPVRELELQLDSSKDCTCSQEA